MLQGSEHVSLLQLLPAGLLPAIIGVAGFEEPINQVHRSNGDNCEVAAVPIVTVNALVVDDSMACRTMTRKSILVSGRANTEVCCDMAADGQKGVDMVRYNLERYSNTEPTVLGSHKSTCDGLYDVIFMDYQMPVMDGPTAIKAIRALGYKGRIVGLTGNALQSDQQYMRDSGANDIILKPVKASVFEEIINHCARKQE